MSSVRFLATLLAVPILAAATWSEVVPGHSLELESLQVYQDNRFQGALLVEAWTERKHDSVQREASGFVYDRVATQTHYHCGNRETTPLQYTYYISDVAVRTNDYRSQLRSYAVVPGSVGEQL